MILVACLDDDNGMMFNHRRQSQDRELRKHLLLISSGQKLWMSRYSAKQFEVDCKQIIADDSFMLKAKDGDYCFVEDVDAAQYESKVEKIIIYRWNRKYPSDLRFTIPLNGGLWKKTKVEDFAGCSHENITMEVHEK